MSENRDQREAKKLKDELLEKEAKILKEEAEAEEERKRQAAAAAERAKRAAAAAAAAARAQAMKAAQPDNKLESKPQPEIHETPSVVFSPEISRPKPPTPGIRLRPEPNFIKKFRDNLENDKKDAMHYDPERGQLTFTGPKGLEALIIFCEKNPGVKITLNVSRDMLKDVLRELKNHKSGNGTLLDKLSAIEMDGERIEGSKMSKLIQDKVGSPRPSPDK